MTRSYTVARIQDIDVRLHPTFALVFAWVLLDWRRLGGVQGATSMLYTLVLVLLVFVCVLLHEFGHAFMARQHGVRVHDVSLSAVGGVARMEQFQVEPRSEILISLAGPAANLAIVAALVPFVLFLGVVSGFSSAADYVRTVFEPSPHGLVTTLVYANLLIVVFNLLPAFPMDGGRIFRAGLTAFVGRSNATRAAVLVGGVFAVVLLLIAIFAVHSIVLALLALFIMAVAYAEDRAVRVEATMKRLRVGQFALWDMGGISPDQAIAYALRGGPRDMAVTADGRVVGMLWRNRLLAELGLGRAGLLVRDIMDTDFLAVDADRPLHEVQQIMTEQHCRAVPIVKSGQYRGVLTSDRFLHVYRQLTPDPVRGARGSFKRFFAERFGP